MDRTDVRVGIVGLGYWGANLLRTFAATPGARVTDLCDLDPAQLAAASAKIPGARASSDLDELIARDDVDAVVLATPPSRHHQMALAALRARKHAWVEKPLALTGAHGRELVKTAASAGRVLFVDETFLYDPLVREMKRLVDEGALGDVYHVSFERLGMGRIRRDSDVWWNSAPHDLSILFHLVPRRVLQIDLHKSAHLQTGIADMALCSLQLEGGVSAHVSLSWLHPEKIARTTVIGSRRMLSYEGRFEKRALSLYDYTVDLTERRGNLVPIGHFEGRQLEVASGKEPLALAAAHFIDSIRAGTEPLTSGARSLRVVEALEAAEQSAARNEPEMRAAAR
jgi:predicted dehydrogenase